MSLFKLAFLTLKHVSCFLKGEQYDSCQRGKLNIAALLNNKIEIKMFSTNVPVFPKEPL